MPGETSRQNGKKGGRKFGSKATHTVKAEKTKAVLVELFDKRAVKIFNALLNECEKGNVQAIKEAFERVWGKVKDNTEHTGEITIKIDDTASNKYAITPQSKNNSGGHTQVQSS
jgi:hypothetical protein